MSESASSPLVFSLPGNEAMGGRVAGALGLPLGGSTLRHFPDGETFVRVDAPCAGRTAIIVCTLHRPDDKLLPLYFLARTLRDLGASRVALIAPYLAYMRQDRRFHEGEGVTARYFGRLVSTFVDALVTVDPHLHRIRSLDQVYAVPNRVVHAAGAVAAWIAAEVERPLIIGPDEESRQWAEDVARRAGAPCVVLEKVRRGDRDVEISVPEVERWRGHTPVLIDDIISTGRTMIATMGHLARQGMAAPVCVGVHGVFAEGASEAMMEAGAARVATGNTIEHATNAIDLAPALAVAMREILEKLSPPGSGG